MSRVLLRRALEQVEADLVRDRAWLQAAALRGETGGVVRTTQERVAVNDRRRAGLRSALGIKAA